MLASDSEEIDAVTSCEHEHEQDPCHQMDSELVLHLINSESSKLSSVMKIILMTPTY